MRHTGGEYGMVARWSDDYRHVITTNYEDSVRIWDAASGELRLEIQTGYGLTGWDLNTDETRLMTWHNNGDIEIWITHIDELLALGRERAFRELNNGEHQFFFMPTIEPMMTAPPVLTVTPLPTFTPAGR